MSFTAHDESDKSWKLGHKITITSCCNGPCCCNCEEIFQNCCRMQCPLCGTHRSEIWKITKNRKWEFSPLRGLDEDEDNDWNDFRTYRKVLSIFKNLWKNICRNFLSF